MREDRQGLLGNEQASTLWKGDATLKHTPLSPTDKFKLLAKNIGFVRLLFHWRFDIVKQQFLL